jgi:hypothetical protein
VKGTSVENGTGESLVATAEPAGSGTNAKSELSIVGRVETILHRGPMVSLLFDINSLKGMQRSKFDFPMGEEIALGVL